MALGLGLGACARSPLYDADDVVTWANTGSALAVWTNIDTPVAFAVGHTSFADPACPATTDDGTRVTITGGCTDSEGERWEGEVVVDRVDGPHDLDLSFNEFGHSDGDVTPATGTANVRELDEDLFAFDVDLVRTGGMTTEFDYSGTVAGNYDLPTEWNGSGTISRDGLIAPMGTVEMRTDDAVWDGDVCSGQAVSGTTTIEGDGHVVVVTYDGGTDCDEDQAARWSVDGEDRGTIEGVTCSVAAARGSGAEMAWSLSWLVLVPRRRRARFGVNGASNGSGASGIPGCG